MFYDYKTSVLDKLEDIIHNYPVTMREYDRQILLRFAALREFLKTLDHPHVVIIGDKLATRLLGLRSSIRDRLKNDPDVLDMNVAWKTSHDWQINLRNLLDYVQKNEIRPRSPKTAEFYRKRVPNPDRPRRKKMRT